jgi:hypothetical protein
LGGVILTEKSKKDKKVGILTIHKANNYGAILQTFAMHRMISQFGYECDVIDFRIDDIKFYSLKGHSMKELLSIPLYNIVRSIRFSLFRNRLPLSEPCDDNRSLKSVCENYDVCVVGSDQVWNKRFNRFNQNYFLEGYGNKFAFGASLGNTEVDSLKKYRKGLDEFSAIYMREPDTAEKLKCMMPNIRIGNVLDPTLLFPRKSWNRLADKKKRMFAGKRYLVCYWMLQREIPKYVHSYAQKHNLEIVVISYFTKKDKSTIDGSSYGPLEFLSAYKYSQAVFTNSFHGMVFSIIFQKPFFLMGSKEMPIDVRKKSLLHTFDLESRIIYKEDDGVIEDVIDYDKVNQIWKNKRKDSLKKLKELLHKS